MNPSLRFSVVFTLLLIWITQLAFAPVLLSLLFFIVISTLYIGLKKHIEFEKLRYFKHGRNFFIICSLAIIYFSFKSFIGIEAGTAVLALFLFAKALETKTKRDLIILFNFALFVSASLFLHSQAFWMAIFVIACLMSCFVGLYRIQTIDFEEKSNSLRTLKADMGHISKFVLLAVPFFIVLFIFFPRFPPLWHVPIPTNKSVTGLSDRMSPGDIAELSQSSALAFRILGDVEKLPERSELYWRAMVLDQYDGAVWTSSFLNLQVIQPLALSSNLHAQTLKYEYLPADPNQKWITSLEKSLPLDRNFALHQDYAITPNGAPKRGQPISLIWLGKNFQNHNLTLAQPLQHMNLQYPKEKDVLAQKFAQKLFQQSQSDPQLYIQNMIQWYQKQGFAYTLQPGVLGENRVDEFLFETKKGFCEHYASSFVMLLRYVGIPARVVVGYQGGQFSPDEKSWEVRQLDAHAWAEVFLNGSWQRFDPTAVIAPQRIDNGMQDYLSNDQSIFGDESSVWQYQQFTMLKKLTVWKDYASFQWQNKVVGYDRDQQKKWMSLFGLKSNYGYGIMIILGIIFLIIIYLLIEKFGFKAKTTAYQKMIMKFDRQLSPHQRKFNSETFQQWMQRLTHEVGESTCFDETNSIFQKIVYLQQNDEDTLKAFEILLKECASKLKYVEKNLS